MTIKEIKEFTIQQKHGWKLFHWIFLYTLIPAIWMFVRVFIVANRLSANVDTYVQWDYVNVLLEVIQDTILMPLFWWFGRINVSRDEEMNKVREVYTVTFVTYFILIMILTFFCRWFY